jgi:hypothetical protein
MRGKPGITLSLLTPIVSVIALAGSLLTCRVAVEVVIHHGRQKSGNCHCLEGPTQGAWPVAILTFPKQDAPDFGYGPMGRRVVAASGITTSRSIAQGSRFFHHLEELLQYGGKVRQ